MAGAQTSEVDAVLKQFLNDFPTVIGALAEEAKVEEFLNRHPQRGNIDVVETIMNLNSVFLFQSLSEALLSLIRMGFRPNGMKPCPMRGKAASWPALKPLLQSCAQNCVEPIEVINAHARAVTYAALMSALVLVSPAQCQL